MNYKDCPVCYHPLPRELYGKVCAECQDKIEPVGVTTGDVSQFVQRDHRRRTLGRMDR